MRRCVLGLTCAAAALLVVSALPVAAMAATRPATHTHPLVGSRPAPGARPAVGTHPLLGTTTTSSNWSGYDDSTDGPFTTVTATWTQPRVRSTGATFSDAAFWVGLDGDGSDTVEQIGTEGYSEGVAGYDAWYEMYPAYPVTIDMAIHAGDVLTGTVTCTDPVGATFELTLVDHTSGASFSIVQSMSTVPALASAEVIAEAPSNDNGDIVPVSDFGLVGFSDCAIDGRPISAFDWNQIDMTSDESGALVARTSALGADGASFTVTTDLTPPTTSVSGAGAGWHDKPVKLHFRATDNPGGQGVAYTEYSLDGGVTWTKGATATVPAPRNHSNDGVDKVLYRSVDNVGNVETPRVCRVRIDTRRPTPIAKWPAAAIRGARTALRFYVSDPRPGSPTATVTIRIRNARGALMKKAVLRAVKVDRAHDYDFACRLARGTYRFIVTATDAAGNRQTAAAVNTLVVR